MTSQNLPTIFTKVETLTSPAELLAVHVYRPPFDNCVLDRMSIDFPAALLIALPSLVHEIKGAGIPLALHVIFMDVSTRAVMLSPILMDSGLPSPNGIFLGLLGLVISGFTGSVV